MTSSFTALFKIIVNPSSVLLVTMNRTSFVNTESSMKVRSIGVEVELLSVIVADTTG